MNPTDLVTNPGYFWYPANVFHAGAAHPPHPLGNGGTLGLVFLIVSVTVALVVAAAAWMAFRAERRAERGGTTDV